MKLFSITDAPADVSPVDGDYPCVAVWAANDADALAFGAPLLEEPSCARVVNSFEGDWVRPERDETHEERRDEVLRQAGWLTEDDDYCCECGLHDMGHVEWRPCFECGICPECRKNKDDGYDCDGCGREAGGEVAE